MSIEQGGSPLAGNSYGVPLGGVGAGCIEMGRDARFRNITINNNRTSATRIPISEGAFLAVRAARRGRVVTRILQSATGLPFAEAGISPSYVPPEQLNWRGLYPASNYRMDDPQFPLEVSWTAMSPIIPYDHEASTLPLVYITVYVKNLTEHHVDVSTVMNWENLCGCTAGHFPEKRGPIRPVLLSEKADKKTLSVEEDDEAGNDQSSPRKLSGLDFGFRSEYRTNAEGNFCLVAKQQQDVDISILSWNERNSRELDVFWEQFYYQGKLSNQRSRSEVSHSGSVCCNGSIPPGKGRSFLYVLAWYTPRFVVDGVDVGNGYTNRFPHAVAIADFGLTYYRYYFQSVEDWQNRILTSSLPRWFNKMLINSASPLSTNTYFTKENNFLMMETPEDPRVAVVDRRLPASLGSVLFFPQFEESELALIAKAKDPKDPGRIFRTLGRGHHQRPEHASCDGAIESNLNFVLAACRNYAMTGRRFILDHILPRMAEAMAYVVQMDHNKDGLPDAEGLATTYEDWPVSGANCYTSGLWIAALRSYSQLCKKVGQKEEADKYSEILTKAIDSYERTFWNDADGYYKYLGDSLDSPDLASACHAAQLAGQWYSDFLCTGCLFDPGHVERALGAICKVNENRNGVASLAHPVPDSAQAIGTGFGMNSWPNYDAVILSALLIRHGYVDRGLYVIQKMYKNVHGRRGRTYSQPLNWDLAKNDVTGWGADRHMGGTSIWHVVYSLLGFYLNVADGVLWVRPKLPTGVNSINVPLFTPVCLGRMRFSEDDEHGYRMRMTISFDSPITLKCIAVGVPMEVEDAHVICESNEGKEEVKSTFAVDGRDKVVEILPSKPLQVGLQLNIFIQQTKGKRFQFPKKSTANA
ncbi:MAG: hypothetical protein AMXMBFR84_35830 [Candidatus Hydrogenedentota bacterium]